MPPRPSSLHRGIERLLGVLDRVFGGLACLALVAVIAVVLLQIVARLAMPQVPAWTEELTRYLFVYAVVLASGSVVARRRHVCLEILPQRLTPRNTAILNTLVHLCVGVFAVLLLSHAWTYMEIGRRQTSPTLGIRMSWIFGSALVFLGLTALVSLLSAAQVWLVHRNRISV